PETVAAPAAVLAVDQEVAYCSEHPYPPGAAAAAGVAAGSGICAFCLQEKLGMLVSSSKSSPFHPPPSSLTPTEPESPGRRSEGSSSSSFGRKVARSRSVGCGSRSFSGDFLERLSTGFGDCALRRVESHREPKPKGSALGHLGRARDAGDGDEDYEYTQQHRIKCAGFFGGIGAAPPASSSYWLSAPNAGSGAGASGNARVSGTRSHRGWAWALASPMRALRPTSSTSSKTIMSASATVATS
uniref:Uncharacterized protein n=1 Tax=Aegilops tauschii subsp. strangulata TaxID=200361 RepID=A0A453BX59_AEGTS